MRHLPSALLLLALAGCGDGRHTPGFILGGDGQPRYSNAANVRADAERTLERALDRELAPHGWRAQAAIAAEPRYDTEEERWLWPATTVAVQLLGPAGTPPPLEPETVRTAVADYFADRMAQRAERMAVRVAVATPAEATAPAAALPAPAGAPPAAGGAWPQRYAVQPGDTLARISAVFYGTTRHWRAIVEANPGVAPETLAVGQELLIPAPPDAP